MERQRQKAIVQLGHGIRRWQRGAQKLGLWVLVGFILLASIVCRELLGQWDMMGTGDGTSLSQLRKNGTMSETSGRQGVASQDGQIITVGDEGLTHTSPALGWTALFVVWFYSPGTWISNRIPTETCLREGGVQTTLARHKFIYSNYKRRPVQPTCKSY